MHAEPKGEWVTDKLCNNIITVNKKSSAVQSLYGFCKISIRKSHKTFLSTFIITDQVKIA